MQNKIVVNDNNYLVWDVADKDIPALIAWLSDNGKHVTVPEPEKFSVVSQNLKGLLVEGDVVITGKVYAKGFTNTGDLPRDWSGCECSDVDDTDDTDDCCCKPNIHPSM